MKDGGGEGRKDRTGGFHEQPPKVSFFSARHAAPPAGGNLNRMNKRRLHAPHGGRNQMVIYLSRRGVADDG